MGADSCSAAPAHVVDSVENNDGWQVEAIAGGKVFACRGGAPGGLQAPIGVIEAMRLQMRAYRAYESPSKQSGVESEVY